MLKGVFSKATGIFGIASLTRLGVAEIGNALLATLWVFLVGYRLYRLSQQ